jgi:outer membrane lipoprotein SlyB
VGVGPTSAFAAIGGSVLGGFAGVAAEHLTSDTNGFEYVVRETNGDMISVAQKDQKALAVGQKVLVIAGPQARIVPDYTVPFEAPPKVAAKPEAQTPPPTVEPHPAAGGHNATAEAAPHLPSETAVPPQLPAAFGSQASTPPPVITPPESPATAGPKTQETPATEAPRTPPPMP